MFKISRFKTEEIISNRKKNGRKKGTKTVIHKSILKYNDYTSMTGPEQEYREQ